VTGKITTAGEYSIASQVLTQAKAVGITILWSAVVAWVAYIVANVVVGLRVTEEEEREGLDVRSHGETAYHT
jgi:Amt family ammonium transporter